MCPLSPWPVSQVPLTEVDEVANRTDFANRKSEITQQLVDAAEKVGFFTLVDHGISKEEIEAEFSISKKFFEQPAEVKAKTPHDTKTNDGWEYKVCLPALRDSL